MSDVKTAPSPKAAIDSADLLQRQLAAEEIVTPYSYTAPDEAANRAAILLCQTDLFRARVVVLQPNAGETNLHYHTSADSFWMVLKGRAKFYGPDDVLIGEFGPQEGTSTPRYSRYWFENSGAEKLELLHIFSYEKPGTEKKGGRTSVGERPAHMPPVGSSPKYDAGKKR